MMQNPNLLSLISMMKQGGNPESMVMTMLQNYSSGNPIMQNLLTLAKKRDSRGIEAVVRNMAKEKGIDFDSEFNSFKQMFGL